MTSIAPEHSHSVWETVKEAVRGSHQDYTEAPIGRAVVLLAVPMVLEMLMESVFVVADVFFVGRLGADAVATVGITESWMTIMYALAIGLSIGGAATVARRIGEKDADGAAKAAVQSIILGLVAGQSRLAPSACCLDRGCSRSWARAMASCAPARRFRA